MVMSKAAELTLAYETDLKPGDLHALADKVYPVGDVGAAIASGSFQTLGMVTTESIHRGRGALRTCGREGFYQLLEKPECHLWLLRIGGQWYASAGLATTRCRIVYCLPMTLRRMS